MILSIRSNKKMLSTSIPSITMTQRILVYTILPLLWTMFSSYSSSSSRNVLFVSAISREMAVKAGADKNNGPSYGIDISLPIQGRVSYNYPTSEDNAVSILLTQGGMPLQPLGNRQEVYNNHLQGCRNAYAKIQKSFECDRFEYHRQIMNRRQPQSMVNLTTVGFQKIRAPEKLIELITEFWNNNKQFMNKTIEDWGAGNSYVNHWDTPTTLVSVDDQGLRGSGVELKRHIWSAASAVLEEWTEQELQPCSLYGIRVYHEGHIMMPHVDRLPLVASAIINVAQDLDEPWPWEIYDHDGMAHNVTLQPGDMLLFESHSSIHGHPFPLKGRYSANIYIHFEPTGHSLGKDESGFYYRKDDHDNENDNEREEENEEASHHPHMRHGSGSGDGNNKNSKKEKHEDPHHILDKNYHQNVKKGHGGPSAAVGTTTSMLPPYIQEASPEEANWLKTHPKGWVPPPEILPSEAHVAAKTGQLQDLERELQQAQAGNKVVEVLTERDENGYQILHQGVAGGYEDVVKLLVEKFGAEINSRTHGGYGETPLRMAEKKWGEDNPIAIFLKQHGGLSIGPEL